MKRLSVKKFILVNVPDSTTESEVAEILDKKCRVRDIVLKHDPSSAVSRNCVAVTLGEAIQPYYLLTFLENIWQENLKGFPVFIIPGFMADPIEANRIFDAVCWLIGANELDGFRKAEAITSGFSKIEKKIRRVGTHSLIEFLTNSCADGTIDIVSVEKQIEEFLIAKQAEENKKPPKKEKTHSVRAISTPIGGQPGWRRK